jgi:ATP-dependent Zn protease
MNNNRKNFILGILTGIFLCAAAGAAWFYLPGALSQKSPQELTIDQTITRINNKDFKEANFKQSQVEFADASGAKWITTISSDTARQALFRAVNDFNKSNPGATIRTSESSASSGQGGVFLIQFVPLLMLGLLAIAAVSLAILAYKALFKDSGSG